MSLVGHMFELLFVDLGPAGPTVLLILAVFRCGLVGDIQGRLGNESEAKEEDREETKPMTNQELAELRLHRWMHSRIPARDALSIFVPTGTENDPLVAEIQNRVGASRWSPVEGGHKVLMPYDGGPYEPSRFTIEAAAWDHEHCNCCNDHIPAMTLCHVTKPGEPYVCCAPDAMTDTLHPVLAPTTR